MAKIGLTGWKEGRTPEGIVTFTRQAGNFTMLAFQQRDRWFIQTSAPIAAGDSLDEALAALRAANWKFEP